MQIEKKYRLFSFIYLLGFPVAGILVGILFAYMLDLVNGGINSLGYQISIILWGGYGLYGGIYGFISMRKMHLSYKTHEKYKSSHNKRL